MVLICLLPHLLSRKFGLIVQGQADRIRVGRDLGDFGNSDVTPRQAPPQRFKNKPPAPQVYMTPRKHMQIQVLTAHRIWKKRQPYQIYNIPTPVDESRVYNP